MNFGEWEFVRRLRKHGHTGEVFVVHKRNDPSQIAALKHYLASCPCERETFLREEKFLTDRKVPSVMPKILESGTAADGSPFFVMEWVESLPKTLPHERLVRTMKEVAAACATLREAGFYHCDLKPSNVGFLNGRIVLIDYGCALPIREAVRQPVAAGTDRFQAPEVADGLISERSEIYSLGKMTAALSEWPSLYRLAAAILSATEKKAYLRPATFEAFAASLDESDADFLHLVRLTARLWRTAIVSICAALALVAIVYGGIAYADYRIRRIADAEVNAARARIEYLLHKGKQHLTNGDYNDAIACFMAVKHNPNFCTNDYPNVDLDGAIQWCRERR